MADTTIQKFTLYQLTGANAYAAMLTSATSAATSATNAATSATNAAASAASASSAATTVVNSRVSGAAGSIAKFTGANAVGNSGLSDDGTSLVYAGQNFFLDSNSPATHMRKLNAPVNQKVWRSYLTDTQRVHDITNDASGANQSYYVVSRSGAAVTTQKWMIGGVEKIHLNANDLLFFTPTINVGFGVAADAVVRIGNGRTADGPSYIDMYSSIGGAVLSGRLIRGGGTNGAFQLSNTGTGAIDILNSNAGDINFLTNSTLRMRVFADGGVSIGTIGASPGAGALSINTIKSGANQVVGPRETNWSAMTGTANKATTYDTSTVTLAQLAGRVMALQAALTTHGLIGA